MADAQRALGNALLFHGDLAGAGDYHTKALATCKTIQNRSCVWKETLNLGNIAYTEGDMRAAISKYREALSIAREIGDKSGIGLCSGNLASALQNEGQLDEALQIYREVVQLNEQQGTNFSSPSPSPMWAGCCSTRDILPKPARCWKRRRPTNSAPVRGPS